MPRCASCGDSVPADGEWIELRHHHRYMCFESAFCGSDCATAYLADGLES
ncbi:hypothetical protein [Halosegnis marinus]|uniref:Uncharacterized protein n=1 Tax=Halosegnis marinus TaxID=3034023 RepID=A0ABD5ZM49_9EURY|nr:hypothetical protein [Halosegnis sp. DT85]